RLAPASAARRAAPIRLAPAGRLELRLPASRGSARGDLWSRHLLSLVLADRVAAGRRARLRRHRLPHPRRRTTLSGVGDETRLAGKERLEAKRVPGSVRARARGPGGASRGNAAFLRVGARGEQRRCCGARFDPTAGQRPGITAALGAPIGKSWALSARADR